jgi:two-component system cell cycle sensor histidine kinase/response regulator CckA
VDTAQLGPDRKKAPQEDRLRSYLHFGPPLVGYVLSLALAALALWLELPFLRQTQFAAPFGFLYPAFTFFYPAIALTSFLAGAGPGIVSIVLAGVFGVNFFPHMPGPLSWIALTLLGPMLAMISARVRRLRDLNRATARELARFKFIGDHASDWIFLLGVSGKIQYANRTASISLGWSEYELTGRPLETLVPEPQRAALHELVQGAQSGPVHPLEVTFLRHDGTAALMELICTGVRAQGDQVIHAAARDITERRQLEQKLREMRNCESMGVMAGGLAHDFNNLLMSVIGNAELAKDFLPAEHEAREMLDGVVSAGERSADLVRMMLATSGHRERESEPIDPGHVLNWILSSRTLPENVRVSREIETVNFTADRRSVETLLWSVISNAAESYGDGEGVVKVSIRAGERGLRKPEHARTCNQFEEGETPACDFITVVVEDYGSGMTPETLERAFDPFFSTKFTGRGLGLPAVRGIVRAYSGKLRVLTAQGAGTSIEIQLPAKN